MIRFVLNISGKNTTGVMLFTSQRVTSGGSHAIALLLVMLNLIPYLRWCLLEFFFEKLPVSFAINKESVEYSGISIFNELLW